MIRPHTDEYHDFRVYADRVAGGVFKKGDTISAMPSGLQSAITGIHTLTKELEQTYAPMSVTITLTDDLDISRGDMLIKLENEPES